MRAPGMTMFRMPVFTWNILITSVLAHHDLPAAGRGAVRRSAPTVSSVRKIFDPENGGPILWQHLFWFFGHPEVYVLALPFFGIVSEIIPVFSRKPIFGYKGLIFATIAIAGLSMAVWAHHMYTTGQVALPFFALMTALIAVPTGVKFFNWIGTMWRGSLTFESPMLWSPGLPDDVPLRRSHRRHAGDPDARLPAVRQLLRGGALPLHAVRHDRVRLLRRLLLLVAQAHRADAQRAAGQGALLARRSSASTPPSSSSTGSVLRARRAGTPTTCRRTASPASARSRRSGRSILGISVAPLLLEHLLTWLKAPQVTVDDPWGYGASLEWATVLPAAAAQLHLAAADPLGASGVRPAPPGGAPPRPTAPDTKVLDDLLGAPEPASETGADDVKVETWLFAAGALFFAPIGVLYGIVTDWHEPVGRGRALPAASGCALLITALPLADLPADRLAPGGRPARPRLPRAPGSRALRARTPGGRWWPASPLRRCSPGLAVGWWLFFIGLGITGLATVGWVFEFYRGEHAH